jgi:hypothetical protein
MIPAGFIVALGLARNPTRMDRNKRMTALVSGLMIIAGAGAVSFWLATRHFDTWILGQLTELAAEAERPVAYPPQALQDLPEPVQRYFKNVLEEGHPHVQFVELEQEGEFRMKPDSRWLRFTATQNFRTMPPGFLWNAHIRMAPLVDVRVVDMYRGGRGELLAKLAGMVTVAHESGGHELDTGELMRYLAEAVWFPTALLPSPHLKWEPVDANSATATLTDSGYEARLQFEFNDRGEIIRSSGERHLRLDGTYRKLKWFGSYGDYQLWDGMRIPMQASVSWSLPEGEWNYWKGRITRIQYRP